MIFMADTSQSLDQVARELGAEVEELHTPASNRRPQRADGHFGIDNGAFAGFDAAAFKRLLTKHYPRRDLCRFVAVPDVVGSARRTLEVFECWYPQIFGWRVALVVQDGQEDLPIPWGNVDAIFVGGSTTWKVSNAAASCVRAAKTMGKWVHIGRVNTPGRWDYFASLGADSCDGTGLSRYSHMRRAVHEVGQSLFVKEVRDGKQA